MITVDTITKIQKAHKELEEVSNDLQEIQDDLVRLLRKYAETTSQLIKEVRDEKSL